MTLHYNTVSVSRASDGTTVHSVTVWYSHYTVYTTAIIYIYSPSHIHTQFFNLQLSARHAYLNYSVSCRSNRKVPSHSTHNRSFQDTSLSRQWVAPVQYWLPKNEYLKNPSIISLSIPWAIKKRASYIFSITLANMDRF